MIDLKRNMKGDLNMNGGLFEGIKKFYTSPNSLKINGIILLLTVLISTITIYDYLQIPPDVIAEGGSNVDIMFYKYLILDKPLMGLAMLVLSFINGAYIMNFANKNIQRSTAYLMNEENIENTGILPDFKISDLLKPLLGMITVLLVWIICLILVAATGFFILFLIKIRLLIESFTWILYLIFIPTYLILLTKFAENYEIKTVLNPVNAFKIIKKTYLPVLWLIIKFIGLAAIMGIITLAITFVLAFFLYNVEKAYLLYIAIIMFLYLLSVSIFALYYGSTFIFSKKFNLK